MKSKDAKKKYNKRKHDENINQLADKIDELIDVINPLNGGGLVTIIEKLRLKVNILWCAFGALGVYVLKDFFFKKEGG